MCGHFGMAGPGVSNEDLNFIQQLAYVSGLRGTDGTGVLQGAAFKKHFGYKVEKSQSEVSYFLWHHLHSREGNKDLLDNITDNFFVGHVRAATKGHISDENSHPFDIGGIVGAHNGTLHDKKYQHKDKTDSEMMFRDISERGLIPVLRTMDESSAYAIVMLDKNTEELMFVRNEKRPLCYAVNKKRKVLYWASEKPMLEFLATRCGIDIGTIYRFTEGMVYKLKPIDVELDHKWRIQPVNPKPMISTTSTILVPPRRQGNLLVYENKEKPQDLTHVLTNKTPSTPLNLNLRNKKGKKQNLLVQCVYCQKTMDLYEQYKGVEIDIGCYSCESCEEVNQTLLKDFEKNSPQEKKVG